MALQIPKLLESNALDIHDVVALGDGRLGMVARHHRAQRRHEPRQRLVQGEQADILAVSAKRGLANEQTYLSRDVGHRGPRFGQILLIRRDVLRVQRRDFEEEQRNAALVATPEPLWILQGCQLSSHDVSRARTKRRVCSNSSTSMVSKIWSSLLDFRQSSVSLNCLKASWGTKRRARRYRL
jgi:hypothetical protein